MANGLNSNGKKWKSVSSIAALTLLVLSTGIAIGRHEVALGHVEKQIADLKSATAEDITDLQDILPEIRDRLTAIETDLQWIKARNP